MQTIKSIRRRYTYSDYLQLDDGKRYEIIEGKLIMVPSPSVKHQLVSNILCEYLGNYIRSNNLGILLGAPMDVYLDDFNIVQPDILFISRKRNNIITENYIKGAPDLVVEILSESSLQKDRIDKKELYERFGVKEYWIVDPMYKIIEVYTIKNKVYTLYKTFSQNDVLIPKILKGLKLNLSKVF